MAEVIGTLIILYFAGWGYTAYELVADPYAEDKPLHEKFLVVAGLFLTWHKYWHIVIDETEE